MKRKKSITFRLSEETIKAIEELSKRYELKKNASNRKNHKKRNRH